MEEKAGLPALEPEPPPCEALSADVWLAVLRHVDWHTLSAVSRTSRLLHQVAASDSLWEAQWMDQYAKHGRSRLSSNEMGGCAIQHNSCPRQEASRALQLLGGRAPSANPRLVSDALHAPDLCPAAPPATCPAVGWRELFRRSIEVDRDWETGRSTSEALEGHQDFIRCMQLSGDTLVSSSGSISHADCSIRVWDIANNTCKQVLRGHMGPIWCMMYDANLNRIASGSDDYTVRYWDSVTGNNVVMQDPDSAVRCIHMDGAGRQLVAGTEFGRLLLWDMDGLEEVLSAGVENVVQEFERLDQAKGAPVARALQAGSAALGAGSAAVRRTVAHLDGRQVVVDGSNHVRVVDALDEGKAISAIQVQDGLCASTSIEPLSRIQLWDVSRNSWDLASTIGDSDMMFANSLSFEKSLNRMVAGCGDRNVRVWDLSTGTRLHLLSGHTDEIHAHQFDQRTLASSSLNGQIRVWDMRSGHCRHVLQHSTALHAFQFDGDRLVSGTWDGRVCLWDLRKGSLVREWYAHNERVWAVAMDRYRIASAGLDRVINVRNFIPQCHQEQGGGMISRGTSGFLTSDHRSSQEFQRQVRHEQWVQRQEDQQQQQRQTLKRHAEGAEGAEVSSPTASTSLDVMSQGAEDSCRTASPSQDAMSGGEDEDSLLCSSSSREGSAIGS